MDIEVAVAVAVAEAKGLGVFAARDFARGETVIVGKAIEYPAERTRMSVQLDWARHVEMDTPAALLNHSCEPNLGVRENQWCAYDFVARRDYPRGRRARVRLRDDGALVSRLSFVPCGSAACQGEIRPWCERDDEWSEQNAKWIAPYLQDATARRGGRFVHR